MSESSGIAAGRLSAVDVAANFTDVKDPLDRRRALIEASRCYFCYDAPCMEACPTGIDIPNFIRKIATDNVRASAVNILEENIFGGACARVCPTEILCEEACVRMTQESKPVQIGALQRYATDWLMAREGQPFERGEPTGKHVAVVGAGPAGLACAHRLAMLGHEVTVYEARERAGGLNEYGIAAYKVPGGFAQSEVDFITGIGGITVECGKALGRDVTLAALRRDHDAVFLGCGLAGVRALGDEGESLSGVVNAVDFIAALRQADDLTTLPVGRRVVVIGGGNTAIDVAVQSKRLGAEDVTLVYRRGADDMSATWHEQEFAQQNGVRLKLWARPVRILGTGGKVTGVEFEYTRRGADGTLAGTGETFTIEADQVFKAIGQMLVPDPLVEGGNQVLALDGGKIVIDDDRATSLRGVFAGGDCVATGEDLTVQAVQDGKVAAHAIDRFLR
ncbi:NAD(P)-dependent oxidoreductase [Oceanibacterium hippocampi]|uniref:dihydrouracil dehydrogenase (NAD(+)) n=1 Tax=Oceanibacterium hippocampi TaxID=745714 RepID=A0A1Y5T781_9PROT|nr:NAD(P)-dependent oxidoreductase [Oceanibacterium hippocampi]SLN57464.1 NAD-dependent dihydropyrimidine dehydrogenase subunit PreT [Oceanibacterium hippocampi]